MMKKTITLLASILLLVSMNGFAGGKQSTSGYKKTSLGKMTDPSIHGKYCVKQNTMDMRINHMKYIKHRRVETTRKGQKHAVSKHKNNFSLSRCINCHGWGKKNGKVVAMSIKDKNHFCASCHRYTAVKIDCFACHQSKPTAKVKPVMSFKSGSEK